MSARKKSQSKPKKPEPQPAQEEAPPQVPEEAPAPVPEAPAPSPPAPPSVPPLTPHLSRGAMEKLALHMEKIGKEAMEISQANAVITTEFIGVVLALQGVLNSHGCIPGPRECKFCKRARVRLAEAATLFPADVQPTKAEEPA